MSLIPFWDNALPFLSPYLIIRANYMHKSFKTWFIRSAKVIKYMLNWFFLPNYFSIAKMMLILVHLLKVSKRVAYILNFSARNKLSFYIQLCYFILNYHSIQKTQCIIQFLIFFWNYNMGIFYLHLFFCPPYMITPKKNSPPFFYVEHFLSNCNNAKKSHLCLLLLYYLWLYYKYT